MLGAKHCKTKKEISSSSAEKENYKSDAKDDMDPDQADDKYPLQL